MSLSKPDCPAAGPDKKLWLKNNQNRFQGEDLKIENAKTNIIHIRLITVQLHWVNANYKNKSTGVFLNPKGLYVGHLAKMTKGHN